MQLLTFLGVLSQTDTSNRSELQQNPQHFDIVYVLLSVGHHFSCGLYVLILMSDECSFTY